MTTLRSPDERACNTPIGSGSTQQDWETATEEVVNDPEKALSSEDEFPDGGLRAWAVLLGVSHGPVPFSQWFYSYHCRLCAAI
jgi:hypothetical protein